MNQLGSSSRDQQPQQLQEQDRQLENRRRAEAAASGVTGVIGGQQNQNQQPNQNQILHQRHHPHPPPQPCPRCSSTNTKFCYYNNYSLAQPRFFCKACRRYWTHGGTLRNVPVGGGGRKTKRLRVDDAHNRPRQQQQQQQQPLVLPQPPPAPSEQADSPSKITAAPLMTPGASSASANNQAGSTPTAAITAVYPATGGGFLSSLTANQAMIGQPLASRGGFGHLFMNMGDGAGGQSNLGLLQSLLGTQIHHNLYPTSSVEENLIQATAPAAIPPSSGPSMSPSHNDWQTFMGNVGPPGSDPRYWSIGRSSGDASGGGAGSSRDIGASSSPNRWPEFPSCGPDDVDDGS